MNELLIQKRRGGGLTARRLAELSGTTERRIYSFARENYLPHVDEAIRIAAVLGVSPQELFPRLADKFDAAERGQP